MCEIVKGKDIVMQEERQGESGRETRFPSLRKLTSGTGWDRRKWKATCKSDQKSIRDQLERTARYRTVNKGKAVSINDEK